MTTVKLELTASEWLNLKLITTSLYTMLRSGQAEFPSDLLSRTIGTEASQKRFAGDLLLLRNLLSRAVDADGIDLPCASRRDLDRLSATFIVEELYALHWCVCTLCQMLASNHPALPAEAFEEDVHEKIL